MRMLAIDTETTGVDFFHGTRPFIVTTCNEDEEVVNWEVPVDPYTRMPEWHPYEVDEIREYLGMFDLWIFHNANFDIHALKTIGVDLTGEWDKVRDTLYAGHILQSKEAHDLGTMAVRYVGYDISKYEKKLEDIVKACRREVGKKKFIEKYGRWRKADKGYDDAPSFKEKTWQADYWLPKAIAFAEDYPEDHEYQHVANTYASVDSSVTLPVYKSQMIELERRHLLKHYETKLKLLPIVHKMESRGVHIRADRFEKMLHEYGEESKRLGAICYSVAESYGCELSLPKAGNNKSLLNFADVIIKDTERQLGEPMELELTEANAISLNKFALESMEAQMPQNSKPLEFIQAFRAKRSCDTAVTYIEAYKRFWQPLTGEDIILLEDDHFDENGEIFVRAGWYVLHPHLNVTGTSTLRWTSSSPNEQNISKKEDFNLRYGFGPKPGREWWSLDAKNIELRIPAYESGEQELISLFERPNEAPYYGSTHLLNFHTVYPDLWQAALESATWPWEGKNYGKKIDESLVGPYCKKFYEATWYKWCKNGGFAIQYGAVERKDAIGTADRAFHRVGSHARLKARFSKLEILNQAQINHAEKYGYVETIPDSTVDPYRGYPLVCSRTGWGGVLPTVPLSYHVQGTAMWWMMMAMIRCEEWINKYNSQRPESEHIYFVMQVHDELVFDLPASGRNNLKVVNQLRKLMEKGGEGIGIPTPVGMSYHPDNWKEEVEYSASKILVS